MAKIEIPDDARPGIQSFLSLELAGINALRQALEETGPALLSIKQRGILVNEAMGASRAPGEIEQILSAVVYPLSRIQHRLEKTAPQIHEIVAEFLEESARDESSGWTNQLVDNWSELREPITALLDCYAVVVESKSLRLLQSRPNLARKIQLFSDSRPVFDKDCEKVEVGLITNTMRIRYWDGEESKVFHLSLDPKDLDQLVDQIVRAKKKNTKLREQNRKLEIRTLEFIDEDSDASEIS